MMRVSLIWTKEIHHAAAYVKEDEILVELSGRHPWSTLFAAIAIVKFRKWKRIIHAKRKANHKDQVAVEMEGPRDLEFHRAFARRHQ